MCFLDLFAVEDVIEFGSCASGGFAGDAEFVLFRWVIDIDEEHEAVELGFREWVGAFLFDGVLGCQDEE